MEILRALSAERVSVHLAASTRGAALTALSESFARVDPRLQPGDLHAAFEARERLGHTRVGEACAAVPVRIWELGEPQLSVIVLREPVRCGASDAQVRILIGLLGDASDPRAHLRRLRELERVVGQPGVCEALADAREQSDVIAVLQLAALGGFEAASHDREPNPRAA
ncbi:MAG: PTS sugar transporter subunit IIA [Myxococcales bacterium]|jgi:mannitol/fructose-specific phosphotransferase system IIA component (Ntr-type)